MLELIAGNVGLDKHSKDGVVLKSDSEDQADGRSLLGHRPSVRQDRSQMRGGPGSQSSSSTSTTGHSTGRLDGEKADAQTDTGQLQMDLSCQARAVDDQLESFCAIVEQRQMTLEQQEETYEQIRTEHDKLRRSYLQAKEDHNVLRRSGALTGDDVQFDPNKELEGQLFRLGMRFDEVQEKVEGNLKENSQLRQPFQPDRNKANRPEDHQGGQMGNERVRTEQHQTNRHPPLDISRTNSVDLMNDPVMDGQTEELRLVYNTNMDAYRKLKYTSDTPEGEQGVENVVRRLHEICTEMPDMFRLSPEIQSRWDTIKRAEQIKMVDRKSSVWEKLNQREKDMKSQRRSPVPQSPKLQNGHTSPVDGRPPSILRQTSDSSDIDSLRARLDGSRSSLGSILPDRMDRPPSRTSNRHDRPSSRTGHPTDRPSLRNSNIGYGPYDQDRPPSRGSARGLDHALSERDRNSPTPSLPRPRRHKHDIVRDPKLSAMPDIGSVHSLPDSGISDQENRDTPQRRHSRDRGRQSPSAGAGAVGGQANDSVAGALAALPNSKFKQMTKQQMADDVDSGFLGSIVGSGVGIPIGQRQQQQQQQQQKQQQQDETLRLRRRADDSSTITDQSLDTSSSQQIDRQRSSRHREGRGQRLPRKEAESSNTVGDSYDGEEEDTLETVEDSDRSMDRMGKQRVKPSDGARPKSKRKESKRESSLDATLEEDIKGDSGMSTSREEPKDQRRQGSTQTASPEKSTASQCSQPSSRQDILSEEDEDLKKALTKQRSRQAKSEKLQQSDREDSSTQPKRLKSPPPSVCPSSRGSPTTDLYHTRQRRASGDSVQSRRSVMEETIRQKQRENGMARLGSQLERPSSRQRKQQLHHSVDGPLQAMDLPNLEIAQRVKEFEERSIGSDVEVGSSATRASSVNSNRLKALQDEIEKLKEGVARANEKASQPRPPSQPIQPIPPLHQQQQPQNPNNHQRDDPEFYDPFDDPYGFMRMPRRRANSFSGGREREWDEWYWTLPQNRQYDGADIPLGYAAADAYADIPPSAAASAGPRSSRDNVRNRLRQRRTEKRGLGDVEQQPQLQPQPQRGMEGDPNMVGVAPPGYSSTVAAAAGAATMQQPPPGAMTDEQTAAMYNYYIPTSRFSAQGMRTQMASRGIFTTPTGGKIYSSTGPQQGARTANPPWYQIRRGPETFGAAGQTSYGTPMAGRRTQSQEDVSQSAHTQPVYYGTQTGQASSAPASYGTNTNACPMCGGASYHTHTNYVHTGQPAVSASQHPYRHSHPRDSSPTRPSRSRSASRSRHYTPERTRARTRSQSRYHMREYHRDLSDDEEERSRRSRQSRSESRGRSRTRSPPTHKSGKHRKHSELSNSDASDEVDENLDRSLNLSMDISRLTKKMLGALKYELKGTKNRNEFGSSYW